MKQQSLLVLITEASLSFNLSYDITMIDQFLLANADQMITQQNVE